MFEYCISASASDFLNKQQALDALEIFNLFFREVWNILISDILVCGLEKNTA